jgi:CheY-like chemotaxis protein
VAAFHRDREIERWGSRMKIDIAPERSLRRALHILVVDDDSIQRHVVAAFMVRAGHSVTCVSSGGEAIIAAKNEDFDVILMDVRMPVIDGVEATRRIRSISAARGLVPIVGVTAQDCPEHIQRCIHAGMDGHILKPVSMETLLAIVLLAAATRRWRWSSLAELDPASMAKA